MKKCKYIQSALPATFKISIVSITDNGRTKPVSRKKKRPKTGGSPRKGAGRTSSPEPDDNLCLIRATDGKKKISTVVHAKDVTRFQLVAYILGFVASILFVQKAFNAKFLLFVVEMTVRNVSLQAYAALLKTNLDGLKKRDKKTAKAAANKAKISKATV